MTKKYVFVGSGLIILVMSTLGLVLMSSSAQHASTNKNLTQATSGEKSVIIKPQNKQLTAAKPTATSSLKIIKMGDAFYPHDYYDPQYLVGAAHNVFVGKVIQQVGNQDFFQDSVVRTQFEVEVLYNIKGNLSGNVVVDQSGGIKDGVLYVTAEDVNHIALDNILHPNSIYLLTTRGSGKKGEWSEEGWYTLPSHPASVTFISSDATLASNQLLNVIKSNKRVGELEAAFPNEKIHESDLKQNRTWNSFQSLSGAEKAAVQSRADEAKASLAAKAQ